MMWIQCVTIGPQSVRGWSNQYRFFYLPLITRRCARKEREEAADTERSVSQPRLPNSQTDDHFNSEPIRDSAGIQNTATDISAMWMSTVTLAPLSRLSSVRAAMMRSLLGLRFGRITDNDDGMHPKCPPTTSCYVIFILPSCMIHSHPLYIIFDSTAWV